MREIASASLIWPDRGLDPAKGAAVRSGRSRNGIDAHREQPPPLTERFSMLRVLVRPAMFSEGAKESC
jgi:hypothetical protein